MRCASFSFASMLLLALGCAPDEGGQTADADDDDGNDDKDAEGNGSADESDPDGTGGEGGTAGTAGEGGTNGGSGATEGGSEGGSEGGTNAETDTGLPDDVEVWELRAGGYEPPVMETKYACFSFTFPTDQLHHIVGITPRVTNPMVHHYVVSISEEVVELDPNDNCVDWPAHILWVWAPGVEGMELPPEAGFLVGDTGPEVTVILQVHYNNPLLMPFSDDDGVDLLVTRNLRPERAGVFTQGDILSIWVPPGEPAFEYVATCTDDVTADLMPGPIHVFASLLHAHGLGTQMWTDVERGGMAMGEVSRDDPFSFNTQQFQAVDVDLEPGDQLRTHCVYDSTGRDTPTQGGEDSNEEMCLNFMMYYPWMPAESCGVL